MKTPSIIVILFVLSVYAFCYQSSSAMESSEVVLEKSFKILKEKRNTDPLANSDQKPLQKKLGYGWVFASAKCDVEFTKCWKYLGSDKRQILGSERNFKADVIKTLMINKIKKSDMRIVHDYEILEMSYSITSKIYVFALIPKDKLCLAADLGLKPKDIDDQIWVYDRHCKTSTK